MLDLELWAKRIDEVDFYDSVQVTPVHELSRISAALLNEIRLKREDLQPVHSFKLRGAYNKLKSLDLKDLKRGVIASSAGNHAQGVAFSAMKLGVNAVIVMPETTPEIKVLSVKSYGASVVLYGDSYDDAYNHALELQSKDNRVFIHPYDDEDVIVGQGTIAKELTSVMPDLDYVFIPVGGGGLIAGMALYLKQVSPSTKVIAVEPEDSACFYAARNAKKRVSLDEVGIFADGVAVRQLGKLPYDLAVNLVDDTVLVSTDEICAAIKDIYDDVRAIAEPAGGLSLAGIKKYVAQHGIQHQKIAGVLCGANINFHRLRHISERAELGERQEALFCVQIPEKKGSFLDFCNVLKGRSITEFNYRFNPTLKSKANIFVGIRLQQGETSNALQQYINDCGYEVCDLSDNEVAKLHVRYMIGGPSGSGITERLYRFQFPERPGALLMFLQTLGVHYNITLFHYRNHGAAYGRVFVGIDVASKDLESFNALIDSLGYRYFDETDNVAGDLFL